MRLEDVRAIAKHYRIKFDGLSKNEIIQNIQRQDGHVDCFATMSDGNCGRTRCLWRKECFAAARAVIPS